MTPDAIKTILEKIFEPGVITLVGIFGTPLGVYVIAVVYSRLRFFHLTGERTGDHEVDIDVTEKVGGSDGSSGNPM